MEKTLNDWENPKIFDVNKEKPHCSYIPYADINSAISNDPHSSSYYKSLNGTWKFYWVSGPAHRPQDFFRDDYDVSEWNNISVPSNWELEGYGAPIYIRQDNPFPVNPPFVPHELNAIGCYKRNFEVPVEWKNKQIILHLGGVKSAFYLWINGEQVGYSQDSKTPAEWNVTQYLREGANNIALEVYQFCDGTYLENQSYWYLSGIQRDVYLYALPELAIRDYEVKADLDKHYRDGKFSLDLFLSNYTGIKTGKYRVNIHLLEDDLVVHESRKDILPDGKVEEYVRFETEINVVRRWTAETPNLYTLVISILDDAGEISQVVSSKVGFRKVEVKNGQLLVNGVPITLKGVNRAEFEPLTGSVVSEVMMLTDIRMMKQNNINAVRCSHYPNETRWYELCDEYGLYVVDEADIDLHNMGKQKLSDNPDWQDAYLDRIRRMVERDKNHPSVIIWSLGNDAGSGANLQAVYSWLKQREPSRPVMYNDSDSKNCTDIICLSYPSVSKLAKYAGTIHDHSLILSEYAFAMGNSLGNLQEYWDLIESNPQFQGGFIREWCDQSFLRKTDEGKDFWAYDGDFNPEENGGDNYCLDGLVFTDRTPYPQLAEVKKVYQYIETKLVDADEGIIQISNNYNFINLNKFILKWQIKGDGKLAAVGRIEDLKVEPGTSETLVLPIRKFKPKPDVKYFLKLNLVTGQKEQFLGKEYELAWDQHLFNVEPDMEDWETEKKTDKLKISGKAVEALQTATSGPNLVVGNSRFLIIFNKKNGEMISWKVAGKELLVSGPVPNFWRAPTDNDFGNDMHKRCHVWREASYHRDCREFRLDKFSENKAVITIGYDLPHKMAICDISYHIFADGMVCLDYYFKPLIANLPDIPRLGITIQLQKKYDRVEWFGRGPHENYCDRKSGAAIDLYEAGVDEFTERYERPQENGQRCDVQWLKLTDSSGYGIRVKGAPEFQFNVHHYLNEDFDEGMEKYQRHYYQLEQRELTTLNLDFLHMGLGGINSWGALPLKQYRISAGEYRCRLWLNAKTKFNYELNEDIE